MCNFQCFATAVITFFIVVFLGIPFEENVRTGDGADGCQSGGGPSGGGTCDSSPGGKGSCCSLNEIIKTQVQTIISGGGPCLPNIGSVYLGAKVVSTRATENYKHPMGSEESERSNKPSFVIEPTQLAVGRNWHFAGEGSLVIRLYLPAQISGVSILHPPACQIPRGYQGSTPKTFLVQGMNDLDEQDPFIFGNYTYDSSGPEAQVFPVQNCSPEKYQLIEFRFMTNYGNPEYTALYKVRIHGDVGPPPYVQSGVDGGTGPRNDEFTDSGLTSF